jgi:magnesium transporter
MIRIFDMMDTVREILSGTMDIYLSTVSNRLNEVMKILTVAATILGMATFITGFFGMNFMHLPWLESPNATRNMLIFLAGTSAAMMALFKWKKWI